MHACIRADAMSFLCRWIVYKETTLLHRRTGTLGAEFSELEAELAVHTGVLDELVEAATQRGAMMDARARRLRRVAAAAGVGEAEGGQYGAEGGAEGGMEAEEGVDVDDDGRELRRHSASPSIQTTA